MKSQNKKGSLFTLLLGNYIIFTILVVAAFAVSVLLAFWGSRFNLIDLTQISQYETLLRAGRYEEFPGERLLGKDGFIAVLDGQGNVVYNPSGQKITLSPEELSYIPDAASKYHIDTRQIRTASGTANYEITVSSDAPSTEVFILDDSYQVIYSSRGEPGGQLTKRAYLLLSNQFFKDHTVHKYQFPGSQNSLYTLLLFRPADAALAELQKLGTIFSQSLLFFAFLYVLLMVLLIFWLKKRINKPLQLLCHTFADYQIGQPIDQNYRGPGEFTAIFENVSAMARRLEESEKQKQELEENRRKMIADIAHDFKTPIAVIHGYARAMADGMIPLPEQEKYLAIMDQKSAQLNELIQTFSEYSKMDHPNFAFHLEKTDICNYFRDFIADQYSQLELLGFTVEADIPETHVFCMADRIQLKRAFANIIDNAVRHAKTGSVLYASLRIRQETVILTLADNGPGIPADIVPNIFTPFVTGDSTRQGKGSGLGLSISKKIIEAHNGKLELLAGQHPKWSTMFQITLPFLKKP